MVGGKKLAKKWWGADPCDIIGLMKQTKNNKFWFILGNFPLISASEITTLYDGAKAVYEPPVFCLELDNFDPNSAIERLGGTIKIGHEVDRGLSEEDLLATIAGELQGKSPGKLIFGISLYSENKRYGAAKVGELGKNLKAELKKQGYPVRHVFNREAVLSSVSVSKNGLDKKGIEFLLTENNGKYNLAKTLCVQPFEEWGARDFGRPKRDDLSGMLPPKLARMMINLSGADLDVALLDPFCGSGTIIGEAMAMGYKNLFASDISERAISDTKDNLEWLAKKNNLREISANVFLSSVGEIEKHLEKNSIDVIITEPYLGAPLKGREGEEFLNKQISELKQIYLQAFSAFENILKKDATIIFIIPRFKFQNRWLRVECVNEIKKLGFTPKPFFQNNEFLVYARPDQKVGREIWRFTR